MGIELAGQESEKLSYSRDFLQRFATTRCGEELISPHRKVEDAGESGDVGMEINLGLSLGGCFEGRPRDTRLVRSSSIAVFPTEINFSLSSAPLARTCSLPVEAEEEPLKRKEMHVLERLEVKRKRLERRNSLAPEETVVIRDRKDQGLFTVTNIGIGGSAGERMELQTDQASVIGIRSLGFYGKGLQGFEASSSTNPLSIPSLSVSNQKPPARAPLPPLLRSLKSLQEDDEAFNTMTGNLNSSDRSGKNIMAEMPLVSTKGDGPNGRRVEGFLYKYRRGEEVRIVCVCHGNVHTPAGFVKHAGGGDVAHPLRHIVVNPSPPVYH